MRLEIHVFHHVDFPGLTAGNAEVLAAIANLKEDNRNMNTTLAAAVAALTSSTAAIAGKLDSVEAYVRGIPAVVAAAVTEALAAADVDATTAAGLIDSARQTAEKEVGDVMDAIAANAPPAEPGDEPVDEPVDEPQG